MELFLLSGNIPVSPAAKADMPGFYCPKLLSHLALSAGASVQGYKTKSFPQTFLVHQNVYARSNPVPEEQQAWDERSRCLQLQLG